MPAKIAIRDTTSGDTHRLSASTRVYSMPHPADLRQGEWTSVAHVRRPDLRRLASGKLGDVQPGSRILIGDERMESTIEAEQGRIWLLDSPDGPVLTRLEGDERLVPLWESEVLACEVEGCGRHLRADGKCLAHYTRSLRGSKSKAPVRDAGAPALAVLSMRVPAEVRASAAADPEGARAALANLYLANRAIEDSIHQDGSRVEIRTPMMLTAVPGGPTADQRILREHLLVAVSLGYLIEGPAELVCQGAVPVWSGPRLELEANRPERCPQCGRPGSHLLVEEVFTIPDETARAVMERRAAKRR